MLEKLNQIIQENKYKQDIEELERMAFLERCEGNYDIANAYEACAYSLRRKDTKTDIVKKGGKCILKNISHGVKSLHLQIRSKYVR